jgi:hypothetical protein
LWKYNGVCCDCFVVEQVHFELTFGLVDVILMKIFGADGRDNSVENDISFCVFIAI